VILVAIKKEGELKFEKQDQPNSFHFDDYRAFCYNC
jgi:hypothetical protein